jgi:hypothetical protein
MLHVACVGGTKHTYTFWLEAERSLGIGRQRWNDIEMDLFNK